MTGMQPTPQTGITADGSVGGKILIENIIKGLGVDFLRILDPYDIPLMVSTVREANTCISENKNGPAVIIARRECILLSKDRSTGTFNRETLETECTGCKRCIKLFDCPAMLFNNEKHKINIDEGLCTGCGTCLVACRMSRPAKKSDSRK
jgi:indolepyruvate ferredoxin oxidoreductase alpha subunit